MTTSTDLRLLTLADLRRVLEELPALLLFVAERRAVLEYDRRVDLGLRMPEGLTDSEKEQFLRRHPEFPYSGKVYSFAEITDDDIVAFLLSPPSTRFTWLHKVTGPPPAVRSKPYEPPAPLIVQVQSEPIPVALWAPDAEGNPYRRDRSHVVRIVPPGSTPADDTDQDDEQQQT